MNKRKKYKRNAWLITLIVLDYLFIDIAAKPYMSSM